MMSGSGPSVFGLFRNEIEAEVAVQALISKGAQAKVCRPIPHV
jgi:4-diphosphocytidyl-2C-methyl-D-erythritol kinase